MLGLFGKGNIDSSLMKKKYTTNSDKLRALLESDLKLIEEEKKKISEAIKALKQTKGTIQKEHLEAIKARLDFIHRNILLADKLAGEETSHGPIESTMLSELEDNADQIISLLNQKTSK
jgi:Arc/MetJ-type ribon-helix-helix transcriptional regulator